MTINIILVSLLILGDIYFSIIGNIGSKDYKFFSAQLIRVIFNSSILIGYLIAITSLYEKSLGKCPELEKIENVYKIKP